MLVSNNGPGDERIEIVLSPLMALGHVKKYLWDLIDVEGKARSMPLYYRAKPHLLRPRSPRQTTSQQSQINRKPSNIAMDDNGNNLNYRK